MSLNLLPERLRARAATPQTAGASPDGIWQTLGRGVVPGQKDLTATAHVMRLNRDALARALDLAPREFTAEAARHQARLMLPMPDGSYARFSIEASSVMEPGLAARFPEVRSYRGQGLDDPALSMRCDLSPRGFHVTVLHGAQFISIQPANPTVAADVYVSQAGAAQEGTAQCLTTEIHKIKPSPAESPAAAPNVAVGPTLRNYRIAIAATWEYCNAYGGGTVSGTVASLNTWLNAANVVYERELAVHLNLVNDTDVLYTTDRLFTALTDPYDNSNPATMLDQVRPDLRDHVGEANYDVGHVLGQIVGTGGSGISFVGVVCDNTDFSNLGPIKGGGATLVGGAIGNNTALGVWVHELGHQFGADHSFNGTLGNCAPPSRNNATAWETGSGSTIMAYSGICGADNITSTRDMRFHSGSYAQMTGYITSSGTCFTSTPTGNSAPTVNGGPDYTIPKQTPFTLTATASDPNASDVPNLTYTWDQVDSGGSQFPQNGTAASYNDAGDPPGTTRPIFRSFPASSSPSRTFPSLTYILNNANDPPDTVNGFQTAEELPRVGRTLNFRVMVRDNRMGGGGVNDDTVVLTVSNTAGPFVVTAPNTAVNWTGGTQQTVTWNVNGTDALAASVKITLSTDGGMTFPTTILGSTPNDGSENITVPNVGTTQARIRIEAVGNIFFDISDANFTITQTTSTLRIDSVTPPAGRISGGQQIRLTGAFANLMSVSVGGVSATWSYSNGTSEITVTTPAHAVGAVNIVLTPMSGGAYTKTNAFAYLPTTFTDNTLVTGVTTVKAQHIIELRQAVDALRAVAGLGPAPWTDSTPVPANTVIKAVHIVELRTWLEDAAGRLGYSAGTYTDPMLGSGVVIKRVHIEELRQRIRTIAG
ncbi:MAG TPA: M12 family metallo-peptidase [Blastocatellia bacterium]|nr:M12 family metallo-peptidase [Blastocatellia bacterium]